MSKRDELIAVYTQDLKEKCGEANPDVEFLTKVTVGLGPSIYNDDASKVSGSDQTELDRVKQNFLIKKLGLTDGPELDKAIEAVIEKYGNRIETNTELWFTICWLNTSKKNQCTTSKNLLGF